MGTLLGQQLLAHWREHVLPGLTVALLSFLLYFIATVAPYLTLLADSSAMLANHGHVHVTSATQDVYSLADQIDDIDGVDAVYVSATTPGQALSQSDYTEIQIREQPPPAFETADYTRGRAPRDLGETSISTTVARNLDVGIGDRLTVAVDDDNEVDRTNQLVVTGIFAMPIFPARALEDPEIRVSEPLVSLGVNELYVEDPVAGSVEVRLDSLQALTGVSEQILAIDGTVVTSHDVLAEQIAASLDRTFSAWIDQILTFALLPIILTVFILATTASYSLGRRMDELRLIRSLGASRAQTFSSLVIEHVLVYSIAAILGLTLATALSRGVIALLRSLPNGQVFPNQVIATAGTYSETFLIAVALGTLSALPAIVSTVRSQRMSASGKKRRASRMQVIGALFFVVVSTILVYVSTVFPAILDLGLSGFSQANAPAALGSVLILVAIATGLVSTVVRRRSVRFPTFRTLTVFPLAAAGSSRPSSQVTGHGLMTVTAMMTAMLCAISTSVAQSQKTVEQFTPYEVAVSHSQLNDGGISPKFVASLKDFGDVSDVLAIHSPAATFSVDGTDATGQNLWVTSGSDASSYFGDHHPYSRLLDPGVIVYPSDLAVTLNIEDGDTARIDAGETSSITAQIRIADVAYAVTDTQTLADAGPITDVWLRMDGASSLGFVDTYSALTAEAADSVASQGDLNVLLGERSVTMSNVLAGKPALVAALVLLLLALGLATASATLSMDRRFGQAVDERNLHALGIGSRSIRMSEMLAILRHVTVVVLAGGVSGAAASGAVQYIGRPEASTDIVLSVPILLLGLLLVTIVAISVITALARHVLLRLTRS